MVVMQGWGQCPVAAVGEERTPTQTGQAALRHQVAVAVDVAVVQLLNLKQPLPLPSSSAASARSIGQ